MNTRLFKRRRLGAVLVEALLAIPVLVLISLAGVQYVQAVVVQQAVQAAADAAARESAKDSLDPRPDRIQRVVNQYLNRFGLVIAPEGGVRVDWRLGAAPVPMANPLGDEGLPNPVNEELDSDPDVYRVTVQVRYGATRLPNVLTYFGIDFEQRVFRATAYARRQ